MSAVATRELEGKLKKHILKDGQNGASVALLWEVREGTGATRGRSMDALSMSLWPSRGLHMTGYELKSSRSDWQRELKKPDKAQWAYDFCHYWYLVVSDERIVQPGELPATWGLIGPKGRGMGVLKESPFNDAAESPTPAFIASLLRSSLGHSPSKQELAAQYEKGHAAGKTEGERQARYGKEAHKKLQDVVREFQNASGLQLPTSLHGWRQEESAKTLGEAVRKVLDGDKDLERVERQLAIARRVVNEVCEKYGIEPEAE